MRIRVQASPSGCWLVMRDTYVLDIYPSHMWRHAYIEACREANFQKLSATSLEITS